MFTYIYIMLKIIGLKGPLAGILQKLVRIILTEMLIRCYNNMKSILINTWFCLYNCCMIRIKLNAQRKFGHYEKEIVCKGKNGS